MSNDPIFGIWKLWLLCKARVRRDRHEASAMLSGMLCFYVLIFDALLIPPRLSGEMRAICLESMEVWHHSSSENNSFEIVDAIEMKAKAVLDAISKDESIDRDDFSRAVRTISGAAQSPEIRCSPAVLRSFLKAMNTLEFLKAKLKDTRNASVDSASIEALMAEVRAQEVIVSELREVVTGGDKV